MAKHVCKRAILDKFIDEYPNLTRSQVIGANKNLGVHQATLYRWYERKLQTGDTARFIGTGRPIKIATKSNIRRIKNFFNQRSSRSQTKCAGKVGCHQTYVGRILMKYTMVGCRKKHKRPYQTHQQSKAMRPKCRRLLCRYRETDFIIDDESYFTLSNTSLAGNDRFYSDNL